VRYAWPGNVRELRNLVERLVVTTEDDTVRVAHLPEAIQHLGPADQPRVPRTNEELKVMKRQGHEQVCRELERAFVIDALRRADWNVSRAARETGMLRPNFHALMRKYGIRAEER
jgi:two-component system response regulator PilR (NtrC family)